MMHDLYYLGIDHGGLASADLIRYHKGWMITRIATPDEKCGHQLIRQILDDADAENVILYLDIDPNDQRIYQMSAQWYTRYKFQRYRGKYRRRPIHKWRD